MGLEIADDEFEVLNYPYFARGKRPKRLCLLKGKDLLTEYMKTARSWEYGSLAALYSRAARKGSFVEVGAHLGTDTVFASDFFVRCYAFEPIAKNTEIIRRNLDLNGISNVELFPHAVSDRCGNARIYFGQSNNSGTASLRPNFQGMDRFEEVQTVTLDSALPNVTDATFIHIDAEGHDIKVLQGACPFIAKQKQQPFIKAGIDELTWITRRRTDWHHRSIQLYRSVRRGQQFCSSHAWDAP